MTVRYRCADDVIWTPTSQTDAAFRGLVGVYAERHDMAPGIAQGADGDVVVDASRLTALAQTVVEEWDTVGSTAYHQLVDGFVGALQVLVERCGHDLDVSDAAYVLAAPLRHNM